MAVLSSIPTASSPLPEETPAAPADSSQTASSPPPSSQNTRFSSAPDDTTASHQDSSDDEHEDSIWYTPTELADIMERSTALKLSGNALFGAGKWDLALETYKDALVELPVRTTVSVKGKEKAVEQEIGVGLSELSVDEVEEVQTGQGREQGEEEEVTELRSVLFANVAACLLKLERWKDAVAACDDSLEDNPGYMKALHRRALASEAIGSWSSLSSALEDYNTLATLPGTSSLLDKTIMQAQKRLPTLITAQQTKEKDEVLGKLKDLGNTVLGKFGLSTNNFKFTQQEGGGYSMNFER